MRLFTNDSCVWEWRGGGRLESLPTEVETATDQFVAKGSSQKWLLGKRMIMLSTFAVTMSKRYWVEQLETRLKAGASWEDLGLVVIDLNGGYFNPRYREKTFRKLVAEAGLPAISFHNLRHSAATLLRSMGVDIKLIQEILGHSNFTITADIYSHVLPSMQKEAADKWDSEFNQVNDSTNFHK